MLYSYGRHLLISVQTFESLKRNDMTNTNDYRLMQSGVLRETQQFNYLELFTYLASIPFLLAQVSFFFTVICVKNLTCLQDSVNNVSVNKKQLLEQDNWFRRSYRSCWLITFGSPTLVLRISPISMYVCKRLWCYNAVTRFSSSRCAWRMSSSTQFIWKLSMKIFYGVCCGLLLPKMQGWALAFLQGHSTLRRK